MKVPIGIVHGRFQLLHNGHINDVIVPAFERCEKLVIGLCNPEPELSAFDQANPHRSSEENNPFTFWERLRMFEDTLLEMGISRDRYEIVPFPINFPEKIKFYIPNEAPHFMTFYDEWGKKKKEVLESLGYSVTVMKEMTLETRPMSGTELRAMIKNGNSEWKNYVPKAVQKLIEGGLVNKLK